MPGLFLVFSTLLATFPAPSRPSHEGMDAVCAIAIRDRVPDYQQWATRTFTLAYLEDAYPRVWYLEAGRAEPLPIAPTLSSSLEFCEEVDLYLLAHANRFLRQVLRVDRVLRDRIRLVYNTGADDADQSQEWLDAGADAYVAHGGGFNLAPIFYVSFLPAWLEGTSLDRAVDGANEKVRALIVGGPVGWLLRAIDQRFTPEAIAGISAASQARIFGERSLRLRK